MRLPLKRRLGDAPLLPQAKPSVEPESSSLRGGGRYRRATPGFRKPRAPEVGCPQPVVGPAPLHGRYAHPASRHELRRGTRCCPNTPTGSQALRNGNTGSAASTQAFVMLRAMTIGDAGASAAADSDPQRNE